jgi:hypothetical protein
MPDINQQRFDAPIAVPPARVDVGSGGAPTSVFGGGPAPNWMNLLPRAPEPNDGLQAQKMQLQIQNAREQRNAQNAMAGLFRDPSNLDENGMIKPEAIAKLGGAGFPGQALELMGTQADIAQRQVAGKVNNQKLLDAEQQRILTVFEPLAAQYREDEKSMGSEAAQRKAQLRYTELVGQVKGMGFSPKNLENIPPNFDITRLETNLVGYEKRQQQERDKAKDRRDEGKDYRDNTKWLADRYSDAEVATVNGKPTSVVYDRWKGAWLDGKTHQPLAEPPTEFVKDKASGEPKFQGNVDGKVVPLEYRQGRYYAPGNKDVTDSATEVQSLRKRAENIQEKLLEQANKERAAAGQPELTAQESATFLANMRPVRSAAGMTLQKFIEENPHASSADISSFMAWNRSRGATEQAFAIGTEGRSTRSIDVAVDHLDSLHELVLALKNKADLNTLNSIGNRIKTEFNLDTTPTTLAAARSIIGTEIVKAVAGGASALADREEARQPLDDRYSEEQLLDIIQEDKRLMAGQLRGLEQQYVAATVPPDKRGDREFEERQRAAYRYRLFPETRSLVENAATPVAGGTVAGGGKGKGTSSSGPELRPPIASGNAPSSSSPAPGGAPGAPGAAAASASPPQAIVDQMPEGKAVTLQTPGGAQQWIKRNGKAERVAE